jgi:hypothetical protein
VFDCLNLVLDEHMIGWQAMNLTVTASFSATAEWLICRCGATFNDDFGNIASSGSHGRS